MCFRLRQGYVGQAANFTARSAPNEGPPRCLQEKVIRSECRRVARWFAALMTRSFLLFWAVASLKREELRLAIGPVAIAYSLDRAGYPNVNVVNRHTTLYETLA
jgi:hypothetical protein